MKLVPARGEIERAIDGLVAPGKFEYLVEQYARIEWPERATRLQIRGRRSDDRTHAGWPDLQVLGSDGQVDAIEVTFGDDWSGHIREDILKIRAAPPGTFASFTLVAWSNRPGGDVQEKFERELCEAGIPHSGVRLVFKTDFVAAISNPKFARLWQDPLRLPVSPLPFEPVENAFGLFGTTRDSLRPSLADFATKRVHLPALFGAVKASLENDRVAIVTGRGASGKTVLATAVALEPELRDCAPAYYLNLETLVRHESAVLEAMTAFGDEGVLFIIDNVHLNPRVAHYVYHHWRNTANRARLLLLLRASTSATASEFRPLLNELTANAFVLQVETRDLVGVYRRILTRTHADVPDPPQHVLAEWLRLFGGDLLAFTAAVVNRANALAERRWQLGPRDAENYIAARYLHDLTDRQRRDLALVAALSRHELPVSFSHFELDVPEQLVERGVISRQSSETRQRARFMHVGIAELVQAVVGRPDAEALRWLTQSDPATMVLLASRSLAAGEISEGELSPRLLLVSVLETCEFAQLVRNLTLIPEIATAFANVGLLRYDAFEDRLLRDYDAVVRALGGGGPWKNIIFLDFAARRFPRVFAALCGEIMRDEWWRDLRFPLRPGDYVQLQRFHDLLAQHKQTATQAVIVRMLTERVDDLAEIVACSANVVSLACVKFLVREMPSTAIVALERIRTQPRLFDAFVATSLQATISELTAYLFVLHDIAQPLYAKMVRWIFREHRTRLVESFMRAPLASWAPAMLFLRTNLPYLHDRVVEMLLAPEVQTLVVERTRTIPLPHLIRLFKDRSEPIGPLIDRVAADLRAPARFEDLLKQLDRCTLNDVAAILDYTHDSMRSLYDAATARLFEHHLDDTVRRIAGEKPEHIVAILRFLESRLPEVLPALCERLAQKEYIDLLARILLDHPIPGVSSLLSCMARIDGRLREKILEAIDRVAAIVMERPTLYQPNSLHWLLKVRPVVSLKDQDLTYQRLVREVRSLKPHVALARALENTSPALARELAALVVVAARVTEWSSQHLVPFLHALRLAGFLRPAIRRRFVTKIATKEWLAREYTAADIFHLSDILWLLWLVLTPAERRWFVQSGLWQAVHRMALSAEDTAGSICLAGGASLVHMPLPAEVSRRFARLWTDSRINAAIAAALDADRHARDDISRRLAQLLVGVRTVARIRPTSPVLNGEAAEEALRRWKAAKSREPRLIRLNERMIRWLEVCRDNGWTAVVDHSPFDP